MLSTYKYKNLTWVDLESPTPEEVKSLMTKYTIHPLVAEELLKSTLRPRVDVYKNFIYLVMHFPIFNVSRRTSVGVEIDFIVGKNFLITTHYCSIIPLHEITKIFEVGTMLGEGHISKNTMVLLFFIIKQLYNFALRQLDNIQLKIDKIEDNIFKGHEKEVVEALSLARCDILDFQRAIHMHNTVLVSLDHEGKKFFGPEFSHYASHMGEELEKVRGHLQVVKETVESLQSTNDSLLTDKANDTMKTLSILAFLTFPLMLFAALFSMDTHFTPIVGVKGDFWIIVAMMLLAVFGMVLVFRRKKWL